MSSSFAIPTIASLKNAVDELRVQYYPKNETERRVYEALSSKNWGASTTLLGEIAADSYDYEKYGIIMTVVWEMIDSPGSSWKQVFKALSLLEFLIKNGAERAIEECRDHMRTLRRLQEYNFFEGTADKGSGVREKSKQIIDLLGSNDAIRSERDKAKRLRNKFTGVGSDGGGSYGNSGSYGGSYGNSGSYGGHGSDSRYDSGRYDSGSGTGGGSGGRRESYSSGGSDRYRDQDSSRDSRRASETSAYGGGSYDSDRKGRYTDEPRDDNYSSSKTSVSSSTKKASSSSGGGKFKVNIKSEPSKPSGPSSSHQPQPEVDFFGSSGPAEVFSPPAASFDAFGTNQSHSNDGFDAFQSAPAPASHGTFDAFSTPVSQPSGNTFDAFSAPAAQPAGNTFDAFSTPAAPAVHNQFDSFSAPHPPPQNFQSHQNFGNFQSPPQQFDAFSSAPQQNFTQQSHSFAPQPTAHDDFGDFEGASTSAPAPVSKPVDKWASLGGLVNLTDLNSTSGKDSAPSNQTSSSNHSSFAGLDGFSQSRQSMNSGVSLSSGMGSNHNNYNNGSRPMGNPMGGSGMGMGGPAMGGPGMGMGGPAMGGPGMGMGMGGPGMGMGGPGNMGARPMGGPGPMGGYPPHGQGYPPQGQGGFPQQAGGFPPHGQGGYPMQGGYPQSGHPQQFAGF